LLPFVQFTVAAALPAAETPIVGVAGLIPGVMDVDDDDAFDSTPFDEMDVTVKVTAVPAVVVIAIGELPPVAVSPVLAFMR
jgi:hypothetical protein